MSDKLPLVSDRIVNVAIIDDHAIVRMGLRALIARDAQFAICGEADDVDGGVQLIRTAAPDVALVDIMLRDGSGLDLIRRVRTENQAVRLLVISIYDESLFAEGALRAGANGYINKEAVDGNILVALRDVLGGKLYLSQKMAARVHKGMRTRQPVDEQDYLAQLSDRELTVFMLIGRGSTPGEIAMRLAVSVKTVDTYRQRIKEKLGLRNSVELSREALFWTLEQGVSPPAGESEL